MKCLLAFVFIQTVHHMGCIHADGSAGLYPKDPVRKIGESITLECRSPENYTGLLYQYVYFSLSHGDVEIFSKKNADSTIGDVSVKRYTIPKLSVQDSGEYKCTITTSEDDKRANVSTQLYVVKADEETAIVEKGRVARLSCLKPTYENLPLDTFWNVSGKLVVDSTEDSKLILLNTAGEDAFKEIYCLVVSQSALTFYKDISVAKEKGAVLEARRVLSVVEIIKDQCRNLTACIIEARVYGPVPANISWQIANNTIKPVLILSANKTISRTPLLNLTESASAEVYINGSRFNIWKNNTLDEQTDKPHGSDSSTDVGAIIGSVLGVLAFVVVVVGLCFLRKHCNKQNAARKEKANMSQVPMVDSSKPDAEANLSEKSHLNGES